MERAREAAGETKKKKCMEETIPVRATLVFR